MNSSRRKLFGYTNVVDLRDVLKMPPDVTDAVFKCRIIYQEAVQRIEFLPYSPCIVKTSRLARDDTAEYEYKYLDKSCIERLREGSGTDDILIVKQNRITDASFAKVIFFDGTL